MKRYEVYVRIPQPPENESYTMTDSLRGLAARRRMQKDAVTSALAVSRADVTHWVHGRGCMDYPVDLQVHITCPNIFIMQMPDIYLPVYFQGGEEENRALNYTRR